MFDLKRFALVFATIFVSCSSVLAAGGGNTDPNGPGGTGGGNVLRSDRKDLEEEIYYLSSSIWDISDRKLAGNSFKITQSDLKPELKQVSLQVLGSPFFTINDETMNYLKGLKFEIINGPCFEGKDEKDASTEYRKNSPICLSASRLSRFPKASLKSVLLPILFHEMTHQFGLGEKEANALQKLAELHIKYRPIFLSAFRARMICAGASKKLSDLQIKDLQTYEKNHFGQIYNLGRGEPTMAGLMQCGSQGTSTLIAMTDFKEKAPFVTSESSGLSEKEKSDLIVFYGGAENIFAFRVVRWALSESAMSEYRTKLLTDIDVDPPYIVSTAAKAVLGIINQYVAEQQD